MATSFLQRGGSLFNIDPGASPEAAARKREILTAMLAGQRKPQYIGEGILDGVSRAVAGWQLGKLDRAEGEKRDAASRAFQGILGGTPAPQGPLTITGVDPAWGQPAGLSEASTGSAAPAGYGVTPSTEGSFPTSLIASESGGNWGALNSEGYGGRLQFGQARLADAARAGVIPAGMTGADFAKLPPEQQQAVEQWHFADIDRQAQQRGLTNYVGQTVGGIPITQDGIRAMAHLGGIGGAQRFLSSGGQHNPADSNGTSLADYARQHGGATGAPMQMPQAPAYSGPPIADLQAAVTNPWLSAEERQMAASLLDRAMQQADPAYQLEMAQGQLGLQKTQMEIAKLGQPDVPKPTDDMREYEFARSQGYQGSFQDFMLDMRRAGATNVTVGGDGAPGLGELSTDYGYVLDPTTGNPVIDPETGLPRSAPIPGSPAARELADAEAKRETRETQAGNSASVVLQDIDKAIGQVSGWTAGAGSALARIPGTDARDLQASLDTVRVNIGFDRLQQMREASPTGGALGGIAIQELQMLQAVLGSLDTAQSPDQLRANLVRLKQIYEPIVRKAAAYPNAAEFGFGGATAPETNAPSDDDLLKMYGG